MDTKIIKVTEEDLSTEEGLIRIKEAGNIIRQGGLVAFPTETVYGLGGDGLNPLSAKKIYAAKGRPSDNPLIIHISRIEDLKFITREVSDTAQKLVEAFWPGPLTIVLPKAEHVPRETTGGLDTVAVRMPEDKVARAFIEAAGGYIAAPSANTSGRPSPTLAKYVEEDMSGKIEMIIDGGQACIGLESTIVDLTDTTPVILRPGYITKEMLESIVGDVEIDQTIFNVESKTPPKAPGMKYRHYAPKAQLTVISGEERAVVNRMNELIKEAEKSGKRVGVIGTSRTVNAYQAAVVKNVGDRSDTESIAKELYHVLREFDEENVDIIYSEAFQDDGLGQAVMNRLLKAAGHHVEYLG